MCQQVNAHQMFEEGRLAEAAELFEWLTRLVPDHSPYHYMAGLAYKYLRRWPESLAANLRAIEVAEEFDEAAHWNAGIAATARRVARGGPGGGSRSSRSSTSCSA